MAGYKHSLHGPEQRISGARCTIRTGRPFIPVDTDRFIAAAEKKDFRDAYDHAERVYARLIEESRAAAGQ